ncbi:helix-turn-helix domain-containing protein [Indiicoccus explosivorum]|uniref:helix-turn-helix domain-containing protein n=1 Tax=Indiicoccus explosivorum TaxID=1917864 RepID=UPI000B438DA1|nr:helix-turn-helix domain-containing protein [Indiicoccus explosivorum]
MKILISERDQYERMAIEWLISTYSIPIDELYTANTLQETLFLIEREVPDLLYIELDMVPMKSWEKTKQYLVNYSSGIIAVTAEATFERAKQALELASVDLLVKPHDPVKIKECLGKALSKLSRQEKDIPFSSNWEALASYQALFLKEEEKPPGIGLMLFHTEDSQKLMDLISFLGNFPFREHPTVLPLTDMVVCLFQQPTTGLEESARKVLREWETENSEPLAAVVIPPQQNPRDIHTMYQTARRLMELTFFLGYRQVIKPEESYNTWKEIDPFLSSSEQREWIDMLSNFDKQRIKRWMHEEFLHASAPFPNPEQLRTRLTSILAQIRRFMKIYQLDQGEMEERYRQIFSEILYNRVLYRIVQETLLFLYDLLDRSKMHEVFVKKDVIEKGLNYIEAHFADPDLSLEKVAEAAGRSPAYYSHLVVKRQGESFRRILMNRRIKEAKRLLITTDLSIGEVAEQAGFRNPSYFTRLFRTQTSMSPRQYRESHK